MFKIVLIANKDNNFYNFRSELILKLVELHYDVLLVCPYGKKIDFFTERGCRFFDIDVDRRGKSIIGAQETFCKEAIRDAKAPKTQMTGRTFTPAMPPEEE